MDIVTVVIGVIVGAGLIYALLHGRTRRLEQRNQALVEENGTLRKHAAEADGAAAHSRQLQEKVDALRERNTALETRVAAAEAARESERKSQTGRIRGLESRLESFRTDGTKLRAELSDARQRADTAETALASEHEAAQGRVHDLTSRLGAVTAEARDLRKQLHEARQRAGKAESALASERRSHEARLEEIRTFGKKIERTFGELSARALERSGENFLQLVTERFEQHKKAAERDLGSRQKEIRNLVRPLGDTLRDFRKTVDEVERERAESQGKLEEQVRSLARGQIQLNAETRSLVQALRKPQTRGRWGEVQLRRVLEMAGMVRNHDFEEQPAVPGALRPDLILRLPGGRAIVVDAKTPLQGYLDAVEATTKAERQRADQAHARHVRSHVANLANKRYWERVPESVDFVVMFLPGEAIFARAIETDPELLDYAVSHRILISTPTTFIALAKAIAYGWRQEKVAEESRKIADIGRTLFKRLTTFAGHLQKTGKSLRQTVEHYNRGVGSFEARLLPAANRFDELHLVPTGSKIEASGPITTAVRNLSQPEPAAALPVGEGPARPVLPGGPVSNLVTSATAPAPSRAPSEPTRPAVRSAAKPKAPAPNPAPSEPTPPTVRSAATPQARAPSRAPSEPTPPNVRSPATPKAPATSRAPSEPTPPNVRSPATPKAPAPSRAPSEPTPPNVRSPATPKAPATSRAPSEPTPPNVRSPATPKAPAPRRTSSGIRATVPPSGAAARAAGGTNQPNDAAEIMLRLLRQIEPRLELDIRKKYIGLRVGGKPENFVQFFRHGPGLLAVFTVPYDAELRLAANREGLTLSPYVRKRTRIRLSPAIVANHADFLLRLARRARDAHHGPGRHAGARRRP